MIQCPSCATRLSEPGRFCSSCGALLESSVIPTFDQPQPQRLRNTPRTDRVITTDSASAARFTTGTVLADRYRIVGLLGRGGMGEVYRAEDLKLSQEVALKFLPEKTANDENTLARFYREVRTARQITHPNVCRVFDVAEADGLHFISMEYVDGEDLASLLRRIGRLPSDKAVEIAQQICSGLSAAHQIGVLHRDLKPANIMLDGRGKVRITDFGLAGLEEEFSNKEVIAGTPAYMAPEQLTGKEVTIKSDIYSLGLVLYEIFTGKRLFDAKDFHELARQQHEKTPTIPENVSKEIDPVIERVILRCLEKDPSHRPLSVLQISAALPGGDPLAAALAAGETPSPELVAAAGKEGALTPAVALACLSAVVVQLIFMLAVNDSVKLEEWVAIQKSREVLNDRAQTIVAQLGYSGTARDRADGYGLKEEYFRYIRNRKEPDRYRKLAGTQPLTIYYWYRQSPALMVPKGDIVVSSFNPPRNSPTEIAISLDTMGRLTEFHAVPPALLSNQPAGAVEWKILFNQAGLDLSKFTATSPQRSPPAFADQRNAWFGAYPEHPDIPIRIEAASTQGKPVYFQIIAPWDQPPKPMQENLRPAEKAAGVLLLSAAIAVLATAALLARRNLRLGRGDRRGAFRISILLFSMVFLGNVAMAHHVSGIFAEMRILINCIQEALLLSLPFWLVYIALEPYIRRIWPKTLISWTRVLGGNYRDPMVGRDILVGIAFGMLHVSFIYLIALLPYWTGDVLEPAHVSNVDHFAGLKYTIAVFFASYIPSAVFYGLFLLFVLFLFYALVRKERLAIGLAWLFFTSVLFLAFAASGTILSWVIVPLVAGLLVLTVSRFGLLAMIAFQLFFFITFSSPMTTDLSRPYAVTGLIHIILILGVSFYGFRTALAGQPLFRGILPAES